MPSISLSESSSVSKESGLLVIEEKAWEPTPQVVHNQALALKPLEKLEAKSMPRSISLKSVTSEKPSFQSFSSSSLENEMTTGIKDQTKITLNARFDKYK